MKKILFLFLFPCLALAQYQGNANQKITLGEQTTADGLVFRGVLNDTALITPLSDTSAYIILDTVNNKFYNYNRATNVWSVAGGGTAVTSITGGTGLTGGTITSTGTLAADTSFLFTQSDTLSLNLTNRFASKLNISDTLNMLLPYFRDADTTTLNLTSRFATKQNNITLTTTGSSGAATLTGATLNIPQYSGGGGISDGDKGDIDVTNSGATWTIDTSAISLSGNKVTGTLPVANGGTNTGTLTANKVMVGNGTSGVLTPTNLHWDNTNSRLGIGTNAPGELFSVGSTNQFQVNSLGAISASINNSTAPSFIGGLTVQANDGYASMVFGRASNDSNSPLVDFYKYRGTLTSKTVVQNADGIGMFIFEGYDGSSIQKGAKIEGQVDGTPGASDMPGRLTFWTTPDGSVTLSERMRISSTGAVTINNLANASNPVNVQVDVNGVLVRTSSIDIKEDVQSLPYGLNEVMLLQPSKFSYIDKYKYGEGYDIGFIAQDVNNVIPEAVGTGIESDIFMDSVKLIPVLTKAIQEQQALIKALEQRILILENK
jgi:hypothetical protein